MNHLPWNGTERIVFLQSLDARLARKYRHSDNGIQLQQGEGNGRIIQIDPPKFQILTRSWGRASTSTFSPTFSAASGLTPSPTPPKRFPCMAWCNFIVSPQKASSPKVSKRN